MISVLVPVYNVQRYLRKCLDSILRQDVRLEIILVDDCSTDNSSKICRKYAAAHDCIKYIHKDKNEGLDMARVTGLKHVAQESRYIIFIDSDDWIATGALKTLRQYAQLTGANYTEMGMRRVLDSQGWISKKSALPKVTEMKRFRELPYDYQLITPPQLFNQYFISYFGVNILPVNLCGKLYKRELWDSLASLPARRNMGEDWTRNFRIFPKLKSVCLVDFIGYNYRYGGMTSHYIPTLLRDAEGMFAEKMEATRLYGYDKGITPALIEMKNYLLTEIAQLLTYKPFSDDEILERVKAKLSEHVYRQVATIAPQYPTDEVMQMIKTGDALGLVQLIAARNHSRRFRGYIKKAIFNALRLIP